jgi:hypothetical protein
MIKKLSLALLTLFGMLAASLVFRAQTMKLLRSSVSMGPTST